MQIRYALFAHLLCVALYAQTNPFTQIGVVQGPPDGIASVAVSPNGQFFAYGNYADNSVRIVDAATRQVIHTLNGHVNAVTGLAFSPNGQLLASTGTVNLGTPYDGTVRVWNVSSGAELANVSTGTAGISQLAFSPDGSILAGASGGDPLKIFIWNATTLSEIRTISGVFRMIAFNSDGTRLATGKRDDKLYLVDATTGSEITNFSGQTGWVQSVVYRADGQVMATGGEDKAIRIRNALTGEISQTLSGHTSYPDYVMFSPDGTMLASLGSGVNITRSGGSIIIGISSGDKFPRIWNLGTGAELPRLNIESDVVSALAFSTTWNTLVTGSDGGMLRVFQSSTATSVADQQIPELFQLFQNYPNPFNPSTVISYEIPRAQHVKLSVFNLLGEQVAELVNAVVSAGVHSVAFDASNIPSGVYVYRLEVGEYQKVKKLVLLK